MTTYRRNGGDKRGSNRDRYRRKTWLLEAWGNGRTVACVHCGERLTRERLEADRIVPGGSYARENIQPSCGPCNKRRSNRIEVRAA